jgi:hypothetical protein
VLSMPGINRAPVFARLAGIVERLLQAMLGVIAPTPRHHGRDKPGHMDGIGIL